jgi:Ca2+-binding RTX toxin-like protein
VIKSIEDIMGTIFVGGHSIGMLTSEFYTLQVGHQFLLYSEDGLVSADDLIIQGFPDGIDGNLTVNYHLKFGDSGDWPAKQAAGLGFTTEYTMQLFGFSVLNLEDSSSSIVLNAEAIWHTFVDVASQIHANNLNYSSVLQNSNSLIGTLLSLVNIPEQNIITYGNFSYYYPAYNQLLSSDYSTGENYSYVIKGGFYTNFAGEIVQNDDVLYAINSQEYGPELLTGDHLLGFAGNDELHDGNRMDTLEGGDGNDVFILGNDGAADIIIVGQGDDIVRGGDANDRLVIRTSLIVAPSQLAGQSGDWGELGPDAGNLGAGLGELALTSAIPILGGFSYGPFGVDAAMAYYQASGEYAVTTPVPDWWTSYEGFIEAGLEAQANGVVSFGSRPFDEYQWNTGSGVYTTTQGAFGFAYEMNEENLIVHIGYLSQDDGGQISFTESTVTIENFHEGDYGIHFYDYGTIEANYYLSDGEGSYSIFSRDYLSLLDDIDALYYINNNGNYITVPAALDPNSTGSVTPPSTPHFHEIIGTSDGDTLTGSSADDLVRALDGDDMVTAGAGNDRVNGGAGNDTIHLGLGNDLAIGGLGFDFMFGGGGDDAMGGGDGDDTLEGGTGVDRLFGDDGADILSGDGGNDILGGGAGDDTLNGGGDDDTLNGDDGQDTLNGNSGADTLHGDGGNDYLSGDTGNDQLFGDAGDDTLLGDGGDDALNGGDGNDVLNGGSGLDVLHGNDGNDVLSGGTGDDQLFGDAGDDTLNGNGGDDALNGGDGLDLLFGDAGVDLLHGDAGNDILWGRGGNDQLYGDAGDDALHGEGGDDSLDGGIGADTLSGDGGNDILLGNIGIDILDGGTGLDRLDGGLGSDVLTGGTGADRFVFSSGYAHDRITDFNGNDFIVLDHLLAADFSQVMSHAVQEGADVVFHFGDDWLTLSNKTLGSLNSGDFEFV